MSPTQQTVTSKDGTTIAYEQQGAGPAVILVNPALADRGGSAKLAKISAEKFTAINYDRRGRGKSSDTQPYAITREVEDIEALIDAAGGSAYLFGSSSGSVLALEAASKLGSKVKGLFMYEPPFIVDDSRPPMQTDLSEQVSALVAEGKPAAAVKLFFTKAMGIPGFGVTIMRLVMPNWGSMVTAAPTLPYDFAVVKGTQDGKPLPAQRWATLKTPTLVMVGSKSEAFFHSGAKALADLLPGVSYRSLEGADHGSATMAPKGIAAAVSEFFSNRKD